MTATATPPEPANPAASDAGPIDVKTIRETLDQVRALMNGPFPRYSKLEELDRLLRGHISLLLPAVEAALADLRPTSVEARGRRELIDTTRTQVQRDLGPGLSSACVQVTLLGRSCRALLRYVPEAGQ